MSPLVDAREPDGLLLPRVHQLCVNSDDGYASMRELFALLQDHGIDRVNAEEMLNAAEEAGVIQEPIAGKLLPTDLPKPSPYASFGGSLK